MPLVQASSAPLFELHGVVVTGLAAPSRGARETCVWRLTLPPGTPGTAHSVDREEIFVALAGRANATLGEERLELTPGDTLIVPAGQEFALANPGGEPFVAMTVLPVGGRAVLPAGQPFTPPWAV